MFKIGDFHDRFLECGWELRQRWSKVDESRRCVFICDNESIVSGGEVWIGLYDYDGSSSGQDWKWIIDDSVNVYNGWQSGQPAQNDERCAGAREVDSWRWHDYYCNINYRYICEITGANMECQPGHYNSIDGTPPCIRCPDGSVESGTKSTGCTPCADGSTNDANRETCESCSVYGTYFWANPTSGSQKTCVECPAGYAFTAHTSCVACTGDTYALQGDSTCTVCAAGNSLAGDHTSCTPCDVGEWAPQGGNCSICEAGNALAADKTSCARCPVGTFALQGDTSCTIQGFVIFCVIFFPILSVFVCIGLIILVSIAGIVVFFVVKKKKAQKDNKAFDILTKETELDMQKKGEVDKAKNRMSTTEIETKILVLDVGLVEVPSFSFEIVPKFKRDCEHFILLKAKWKVPRTL